MYKARIGILQHQQGLGHLHPYLAARMLINGMGGGTAVAKSAISLYTPRYLILL